MKTQYTKGKWIAEILDGENQNFVIYTSQKPEGIANIYPSPNAKADALLIAAAPELLAACKALIKDIEEWLPTSATEKEYPETLRVMKQARAAISAAEGN